MLRYLDSRSPFFVPSMRKPVDGQAGPVRIASFIQEDS